MASLTLLHSRIASWADRFYHLLILIIRCLYPFYMIHFQPFGQAMSIADTGASAGTIKSWVASCISSRSGMESGCGKKLHVSKFGVRRLIYPVVRTRSSVVFGNACLDSTDNGLLALKHHEEKPRSPSDLKRANAGARSVVPMTNGARFKTDNRISTKQHIRIPIRRYLATLVSGNYLPAWYHITFTMLAARILLWTATPGPWRWQAR